MDYQKVELFLATKAKFFDPAMLPSVKELLEKVDDSKSLMVQSIDFKDPTTTLLISLFGGSLGIDRFFLGDMGLGIGKLLTAGGCGIWTIIDWFLIMGAARQKNYELLVSHLSY